MSSTRVGIEVDGDRVTVVEVLDDVAVTSRSVDVGDLEESFTLALAGFEQSRKDPPVRVALCTSRLTVRRIDVTSALRERDAFEEAAFEAVPVSREDNSPAGLFFRPDLMTTPDVVSAGVVAVVPAEEVDRVYQVCGKRRAEVVTPSFTLRDVDSLWLGLRFSSAELSLVRGDHVVQTRQLQAGGLSAVAAALDPDNVSLGVDRVMRALDNPGADVIAEAEVDRYLALVASEARRTIDFWERSGDSCGSDVVVFGPGALAVKSVESSLRDQDLAVAWPQVLIDRMSYLAPRDRPLAVGAYFAALTIGEDLPQAVFLNPQAVEVDARRRKAAGRVRYALAAAAVLAAVLVTSIVPALSQYRELSALRSQAEAAQKAFDQRAGVSEQLADLSSRSEVMGLALSTQPSWSSIIKLINQTAPAGAVVTQQTSTVDGNDVVVSLTAELPGGTYYELTQWLAELASRGARTWSPNFSTVEGVSTYQVTFTVPLVDWPTSRAVPAVPGEESVVVPVPPAGDVAVPTPPAEDVAVPVSPAEDIAVPVPPAEDVAVPIMPQSPAGVPSGAPSVEGEVS